MVTVQLCLLPAAKVYVSTSVFCQLGPAVSQKSVPMVVTLCACIGARQSINRVSAINLFMALEFF